MREKLPQLERALAGRFGPHQRFLLAQQLAHLDCLDAPSRSSERGDRAARLRPFEEAIERLDTIPGVGRATAEVLLAEIGTDMAAVPQRRPPGLVGGLVSGQQRERGQAQERQDAQGLALAARGPGRGGPGRPARTKNDLPGGAVPAPRRAPRGQARGGRRGP